MQNTWNESFSGREELLKKVPGWERWEWLTAGFSTRWGGVSTCFAEVANGAAVEGGDGEGGDDLNLGFTSEDWEEAVLENRRRLAEAAGGGWRLVVVRQVHGVEVREVSTAGVEEAMAGGRGQWEADGVVTKSTGLLLGVGAADCVPVLVADVRRRVVGAFHAGWRGTAEGMARIGVGRMAEIFGTEAVDCVAAIGPSIGVCCYEVGEEVRSAFAGETEAAGEGRPLVRPGAGPGRWQLDLWEANRRQLVKAGVPAAAVTILGECTACTRTAQGRRRYFSHRAENGRTGRMLGVIGVRER